MTAVVRSGSRNAAALFERGLANLIAELAISAVTIHQDTRVTIQSISPKQDSLQHRGGAALGVGRET